MTKTIEALKAAQQAIAEAVYHGATKLAAEDEKELRYMLHKIPGILKRVEGK